MYCNRADLFDFVWSQPRTALAKRFNVSDVAIAKHCRSANIPMPPPGYWARVAAGSTGNRPTLPLRLPGEKDLLAIGERHFNRGAEPLDYEAPSFPEDTQTLVAAALKRLGRVTAQRDLNDPHRALASILKKEEQRRQKFTETNWSYYQPYFADAASQRRLRLYSAIFRAFARLGIRGAVSEDSEWRQGSGTTYKLVGTLEFSGATVRLSFAALAGGKESGLKLTVGGESERSCHSVWSDAPHRPLERQLDEIAQGILVCAEDRLRERAQQRHAWRVQERERRRLEQEQTLRAQQEAHAAQLLRKQERRRQALYAIATQRQRALEIRSLLTALQSSHPAAMVDASFRAWCEFAAGEADRLDPLLNDWRELVNATAAEAPASDADTQ